MYSRLLVCVRKGDSNTKNYIFAYNHFLLRDFS